MNPLDNFLIFLAEEVKAHVHANNSTAQKSAVALMDGILNYAEQHLASNTPINVAQGLETGALTAVATVTTQ